MNNLLKYEQIHIKPLGAGSEVGRSCVHVKYQDLQFLFDCGIHPAYNGICSLPFFDLVDLSQINAVFITHFHLDHAAALPFLTEKTNFKGKVYMTHPTKAILKYLLTDFIRVINSNSKTDFYSEKDLVNCYEKITPIDYHQEINVCGVKLTAYNAGHVLGAAMFRLEIGGVSLLYTGDFSMEEDRHLKKADSMKDVGIHILLTESTYGTQCHLSRVERESRFTKTVTDVVTRGGKCLLPVFALGRAQELLLILEEHWAKNPSLQKIPIYYNSTLAKRCMGIYQTYLNMMNERMQKIGLTRNPFEFKFIQDITTKELSQIKDNDKPYVVMASPGMLQSGVSRDLFDRWCSNNKNGVIIAGYCVDGTLAKEILSNVDTVTTLKGQTLKLALTVECVSFSAHVDFIQNSSFIYECNPSHLFFVHGEATEMGRLKNAIAQKNEKEGIDMQLYTLKNGESACVEINSKKYVEVKLNNEENEFDGILIKERSKFELYKLDEFLQENNNNFKKIKLYQKQKIPFNTTFDCFKHVIEKEFDAKCIDETNSIYLINNTITVQKIENDILFTWENKYEDDILVMAILKELDEFGTSGKTVRLSVTEHKCEHSSDDKECRHSNGIKFDSKQKMNFISDVLKGYYNNVVFTDKNIVVEDEITVDENFTVHGKNLSLKNVIEEVIKTVLSLFD